MGVTFSMTMENLPTVIHILNSDAVEVERKYNSNFWNF